MVIESSWLAAACRDLVVPAMLPDVGSRFSPVDVSHVSMRGHNASLFKMIGKQPGGILTCAELSKTAMPLYIIEKLVDNVMVLELRGRLTLGPETEKLREKARQVVEAGYSRIILDLEEVDYIDSVGLSTLVACYTAARKQGGDMKLLHLTKRINDLLQITRLSTVFEIYNTLEEAQRSFRE